jgi:hypothetical protein
MRNHQIFIDGSDWGEYIKKYQYGSLEKPGKEAFYVMSEEAKSTAGDIVVLIMTFKIDRMKTGLNFGADVDPFRTSFNPENNLFELKNLPRILFLHI